MLLLLALMQTGLACPSLDGELERATAAIIAGDLAAATAALDDARSSFSCAQASPAGLGRYFLLRGAVATQGGGDPTDWLSAARRLALEGFDPRLGPELQAAFKAAPTPGRATLLLEPTLPAALDGEAVVDWPIALSSGAHLVQVIGTDGKIRFNKEFNLLPDEDALLSTGLSLEAPVVAAPAPRKRRGPVLLVASAVAAAAGGSLAAGALAQNETMSATGNLEAFDAAHTRQRAFAYGAYGLGGAAVVGAALYFVIP